MTPKVKENKEFAEWFRDWIAIIQQNRASVERALRENKISADGQEHSDGHTGLARTGRPLRWSSCGRHFLRRARYLVGIIMLFQRQR
jgi:hypothetical protein